MAAEKNTTITRQTSALKVNRIGFDNADSGKLGSEGVQMAKNRKVNIAMLVRAANNIYKRFMFLGSVLISLWCLLCILRLVYQFPE
jgi:hypothetical protein